MVGSSHARLTTDSYVVGISMNIDSSMYDIHNFETVLIVDASDPSSSIHRHHTKNLLNCILAL